MYGPLHPLLTAHITSAPGYAQGLVIRSSILSTRRKFLSTAGASIASVAGSNLFTGLAGAQSVPLVSVSATVRYLHTWARGTEYTTNEDGRDYGTLADGPFNPYRRSSSDIMRGIVPQSENRTLYLVHGSMAFPSFSPTTPMTFNSPRYTNFAMMDMRHWLFSVFNVDTNTAFAMAHSENYTQLALGGRYPWPDYGHSNFKQFVSLSLFRTKPRTGNHDEFTYAYTPTLYQGTSVHSDLHLILHPAPPEYMVGTGIGYHYGFHHPSNMIEDDGYVYVFAQHLPATKRPSVENPSFPPINSDPLGKAGPVLLRCQKSLLGVTGNPANLNGNYWQIFNSAQTWQFINRWGWADASISSAPIKPYVFYRNAPSTGWLSSMGLAQAVRKVGSKFVVIGVKFLGALHYSYCSSLANPLELENNLTAFGQSGGPSSNDVNLQNARYLSFFDPYDIDTNYRNAVQNDGRVVLVVSENYLSYKAYPMALSGF